jgi:hypothetical protein
MGIAFRLLSKACHVRNAPRNLEFDWDRLPTLVKDVSTIRVNRVGVIHSYHRISLSFREVSDYGRYDW